MLVYQKADFVPDPKIDFSRNMKTKKQDWRKAEAEVLGADFVLEQEDRIKAGVKMSPEVRDQLVSEGDRVLFNLDKLKKPENE